MNIIYQVFAFDDHYPSAGTCQVKASTNQRHVAIDTAIHELFIGDEDGEKLDEVQLVKIFPDGEFEATVFRSAGSVGSYEVRRRLEEFATNHKVNH